MRDEKHTSPVIGRERRRLLPKTMGSDQYLPLSSHDIRRLRMSTSKILLFFHKWTGCLKCPAGSLALTRDSNRVNCVDMVYELLRPISACLPKSKVNTGQRSS